VSDRRRAARTTPRAKTTSIASSRKRPRRPGEVPLARALSKLGIASRSAAIERILHGDVAVNGRPVRDPGRAVVPERDRISLAGTVVTEAAWRTILLHKRRGTVTTRRDPDGRATVYDDLPAELRHLTTVGRLDLATAGALLLTTDTQLAHWLTDPVNAVPRMYVVTVQGLVAPETAAVLEHGIVDRGETLVAERVTIRKASRRETHLAVELREGKNREIRRLFASAGHEVIRLSRVAIGGIRLGDLAPGQWRDVTRAEARMSFPGAPVRRR
jgi:23S rRNA pseudouridine2605 synthase